MAGLVDSDGSVVLNYNQNCITVAVEINTSPLCPRGLCPLGKGAVRCLNFDAVIPGTKPNKVIRTTASGKQSIRFVYQSVCMILYDSFHRRSLYSSFKYYVTRIKRFMVLRHYKSYLYGTVEQKLYSEFCLDFIKYQNPEWATIPLVAKLDKDIVQQTNRSLVCISTTY